MNAPDNGGPAFPRPTGEIAGSHQYNRAQEGMSLRDYFAIHASESDIRSHQQFEEASYGGSSPRPRYTREQARYLFADQMLLARKGME